MFQNCYLELIEHLYKCTSSLVLYKLCVQISSKSTVLMIPFEALKKEIHFAQQSSSWHSKCQSCFGLVLLYFKTQ